jgi:hypothetical protein
LRYCLQIYIDWELVKIKKAEVAEAKPALEAAIKEAEAKVKEAGTKLNQAKADKAKSWLQGILSKKPAPVIKNTGHLREKPSTVGKINPKSQRI